MADRISTRWRRGVVLSSVATLAIGGVGSGWADAPPAPPPDCQCRAPGGDRRDLGSVACVEIAGRPWLVRCEMSTNTPFWKRVRTTSGCEFAALTSGHSSSP